MPAVDILIGIVCGDIRERRRRHLAAPSPPPPGRPGIDHDLPDVRFWGVALDPRPARIGAGESRLHEVLGQCPVAGQKESEPLQRLAAGADEGFEAVTLRASHRPPPASNLTIPLTGSRREKGAPSFHHLSAPHSLTRFSTL